MSSSQSEQVCESIPAVEVNGTAPDDLVDKGDDQHGESLGVCNNIKRGRTIKRAGSRGSRKLGRRSKRAKPMQKKQAVEEEVIPATVVVETHTAIPSAVNRSGGSTRSNNVPEQASKTIPADKDVIKEVSQTDNVLLFVGQSVIDFTNLLLSNSKKRD